MIRSIDKRWFRLLGKVHRWTLRKGKAHCQREKMRRFRRLMEAQNPRLN